MIEVDPDKVATFGNGLLTAAADLTATRLALAARAMAGGGLGAAENIKVNTNAAGTP